MKYRAHLSTGGTIDLQLNDDVQRMLSAFADTWLVDEIGNMVRAAHIVTLEPLPASAPTEQQAVDLPAWLIDEDGDRWERQGIEDEYRYRLNDDLLPGWTFTLEDVKEKYGISERG